MTKVVAREAVVVAVVNMTKGRKERIKSRNGLKDILFIRFPPYRKVTYSLLRRDSNSHDMWECDADENIPRIVVLCSCQTGIWMGVSNLLTEVPA